MDERNDSELNLDECEENFFHNVVETREYRVNKEKIIDKPDVNEVKKMTRIFN